jgi:hypothetical protein
MRRLLSGAGLVSAARFNCELFEEGVSASNLQTFLGIRAPQPPAGAREGSRIGATSMPTEDEVRRIMRVERERRF